MRLRPVAAWACIGFGLLVAGAGIGHSVASGRVAFVERGGFDSRFRLLLAVGWMLLCGGLLLAFAGLSQLRARPWAIPLGLVTCAFLLGTFSILYTIGGPVGIPAVLTLGVLLVMAHRTAG
ncbi:MAG TPA: hypothetical protein VM286_06475 [Candidatus Thermoplasmatota archaeon]|nr:hypothetical protein [Candidatus Thermoplasmatota archaeon]